MERFWRSAGIQLGRYWWAVFGAMLAITVLLAFGLTRLEFATGQDSYLNQDSQIAIDNVRYQADFGGETAIVLFQAQEGHDITELFEGANLEELKRLEAELRDIPEVYAVLAPLTAVQYSEAIVTEGVGTNALLSAAERDPDPKAKEIRQADISTTLARLNSVQTKDMSNPDWVNFLLFDTFAAKNTYEVKLDAKGNLIWLEQTPDGQVTYVAEPKTSRGRRLTVWIVSLLPVEWML